MLEAALLRFTLSRQELRVHHERRTIAIELKSLPTTEEDDAPLPIRNSRVCTAETPSPKCKPGRSPLSRAG